MACANGYLTFDPASDESGIDHYEVSFSKDGGSTWCALEWFLDIGENLSYQGEKYEMPMSLVTHIVGVVDEQVKVDKVKVLSKAATAETGKDSVVEEVIDFTYTVAGDAIAGISLTRTNDNLTFSSSNIKKDGAFLILVISQEDLGDVEYTHGWIEEVQTEGKISIAITAADNIPADATFVVRKVTNVATSGLTLTPKSAETSPTQQP